MKSKNDQPQVARTEPQNNGGGNDQYLKSI